jgi:hypothetical protein
VGAVGFLLRLRLVPAFLRVEHVFTGLVISVITLVAKAISPVSRSAARMFQIRAAAVSCVLPGN